MLHKYTDTTVHIHVQTDVLQDRHTNRNIDSSTLIDATTHVQTDRQADHVVISTSSFTGLITSTLDHLH